MTIYLQTVELRSQSKVMICLTFWSCDQEHDVRVHLGKVIKYATSHYQAIFRLTKNGESNVRGTVIGMNKRRRGWGG